MIDRETLLKVGGVALIIGGIIWWAKLFPPDIPNMALPIATLGLGMVGTLILED